MVCRGADELTLRSGEEGTQRAFIGATNVGVDEELRLVDEDWHASCQAIFRGVDGEKWERLYHKYVELHQAVNL